MNYFQLYSLQFYQPGSTHMKKQFMYLLVAMFGIFLGSQITEAVLLVPYWQSLSTADFYIYYQEFGPAIGRFYTFLTIIAALIPVGLSMYLFRTKTPGIGFAVTSSVFAVLFVACFYIYFKSTNEMFYQSALSSIELKNELIIWSNWHWGRIVLEGLSLLFLVLAVTRKN